MDDAWKPVVKPFKFIFSAFFAVCLNCRGQQCVVDWDNVHQQIDGFGASSAFQTLTWTSTQANMFFSTNSGIGLSLLRMQVQPQGFTEPNEIALAQMAQARGAKIWATPWTPPASFKNNNNTIGGNFVSANNQAYANELAGYVAKLTNSNIHLYALSIQNEPDAVVSYVSCYWSPQQFHDFIPYLSKALAASNVASTKIMLPESEGWDGTSFETTAMNDATVAAQVGILANHNYDGIDFNHGATGVPDAHNTYGKPFWETEVSTGDAFDGSIANAIYWAGRIHLFMTVAQANAWHYWWLIPWGGTDNQGLTDASGHPAKRMYALGQFSRFVRPNFNRIDAEVTQSAALISAYKDSASAGFAIVAINPTSSAISQTFSLSNFSADSVTPWITSASASLQKQSAVSVANSTFTYQLPAMSIMTFVGQATIPQATLTVFAGPASGGKVIGAGIYDVGSVANISATADTGWVFTGWSDGSKQNPRTITVDTGGETLTANFIFKGLNAQFSGLFYDTNGIAPQSSGAFKAKLTASGTYSGSLMSQGKTYSFSGKYLSDGSISNKVARTGQTPLIVQLKLDPQTDEELNGKISTVSWTATAFAQRDSFSAANKAPQAGKYTMAIPGAVDPDIQPGGNGYGAITVSASGAIALSGSLGDATAVSQSAAVSDQGFWPLYVSLYSGGGEFIGWLTFSNSAAADLTGMVTWIKPNQKTSKLYPAGFTWQTIVIGSHYGYTNGHPILGFTNADVVLSGGNLSSPIENTTTVAANGKMTGTNHLSLTVNTANGVFTGSIVNPATKKTISISGVVLEKQTMAVGHFVGTNQSGSVSINAGP